LASYPEVARRLHMIHATKPHQKAPLPLHSRKRHHSCLFRPIVLPCASRLNKGSWEDEMSTTASGRRRASHDQPGAKKKSIPSPQLPEKAGSESSPSSPKKRRHLARVDNPEVKSSKHKLVASNTRMSTTKRNLHGSCPDGEMLEEVKVNSIEDNDPPSPMSCLHDVNFVDVKINHSYSGTVKTLSSSLGAVVEFGKRLGIISVDDLRTWAERQASTAPWRAYSPASPSQAVRVGDAVTVKVLGFSLVSFLAGDNRKETFFRLGLDMNMSRLHFVRQ